MNLGIIRSNIDAVVDEEQDVDIGRKLTDCLCSWLDCYHCRPRTATPDNKQVRKQTSANPEVAVTLESHSEWVSKHCSSIAWIFS